MYLKDEKLIFVHATKTGGSTIAAGLLEKSIKRFKFSTYRKVPAQYRGQYLINDKFKHATAEQLQRKITFKYWNECHKFAMIRNPWDRFVSMLVWRSRPHKHGQFKKMFRDAELKLFQKRVKQEHKYFTLTRYLCKDNKLLVDEVYDLDNIETALQKYDIENRNRKRLNSKYWLETFEKHDYQKLDDIVNCIYRDDIEFFDYSRPSWLEQKLD